MYSFSFILFIIFAFKKNTWMETFLLENIERLRSILNRKGPSLSTVPTPPPILILLFFQGGRWGASLPPSSEIATHSSILAWEIPWSEEPGRLQSMGSQKGQTWLSNQTLTTTLWMVSGFPRGFYCHTQDSSDYPRDIHPAEWANISGGWWLRNKYVGMNTIL